MRRFLKFIFLPLLMALFVWYFARQVDDWGAVWRLVRNANPLYIALAVLVICLGYLVRAVRWQVLLEPITPSSLKELFATTTVGFAAVFLVGRAGEIVRPMWLPLRDRRVRPSAALVTLGVERIFDLASVICFFAINLVWFVPAKGHEAQFKLYSDIGMVMLAMVFVGYAGLYLYYRWSARIMARVEAVLDRRFIPKRAAKMFLSLLRQLAAALAVLTSLREILLVVFWTFVLWLSIAIPTWLVLLAFDPRFGLSDSLFIMGFAVFGSLVPTAGGAAGAFHTATSESLKILNTEEEMAAAISIVMHLVYFAPAIVFGAYYFVHGDISLARFKELLSSDHAVEEIESDVPNLKSDRKGE